MKILKKLSLNKILLQNLIDKTSFLGKRDQWERNVSLFTTTFH